MDVFGLITCAVVHKRIGISGMMRNDIQVKKLLHWSFCPDTCNLARFNITWAADANI